MSSLTAAVLVTGRPGRVWTRTDPRSLARLLGVVATLHVAGAWCACAAGGPDPSSTRPPR